MKIMSANRLAPDGTPRFAASHLGLFCLPMSHKKDARRISVKYNIYEYDKNACIVISSSLLCTASQFNPISILNPSYNGNMRY